ncbi:hypothetical protein [Streptomyces sp. CB03911]|uniref:hypothetical protein n=1 Tax=Streptomyces sp. CB03911 TaxID=1804758 RepID=UPI00093E929A|nr:hypothetical protein [Streptomyces sp. CB03911]OKI19306.1 hypothetical protein A6A07_07335 [Streptomyces sp. CB03911]
MSELADAIAVAMERAIREHGVDWMLATVTAVGTGVVSVSTALGPVANVRRLKSYSSPTVGETVMVSRNSAGNWIVTGALA